MTKAEHELLQGVAIAVIAMYRGNGTVFLDEKASDLTDLLLRVTDEATNDTAGSCEAHVRLWHEGDDDY